MFEVPSLSSTVYFDGGCLVCSRELAMFQRQPSADWVVWIGVTRCGAPDLGTGLTRDAAMARLRLRRPDGRLVRGARAFTRLWRILPRWAWLGRMLAAGAGLWLLAAGHRGFLVIRRGWRPAG